MAPKQPVKAVGPPSLKQAKAIGEKALGMQECVAFPVAGGVACSGVVHLPKPMGHIVGSGSLSDFDRLSRRW